MSVLVSEMPRSREIGRSNLPMKSTIDLNQFLTTKELHVLLGRNHSITSPKEKIKPKSLAEKYSYKELDEIHDVLVSKLKNNNYHSRTYILTILAITEKINRALDQKIVL